MELLLSKSPKVTEASISNDHIDLVLKMCRRNAAKGPTIHSYLASHPDLVFEIVKNLQSILLECHRIWCSFCPSIPSIVPYQTIYVLS